MESKFFETNSYFIDEKVNYFKFENAYKIFNDKGENIGSINQKIPFGQKVLRLVLNKAMLPFMLEIRNANERVEASLVRGWTFWMSKIKIMDAKGSPVGTIQQKFKLFKPTFKIFDLNERVIAEITGDWKAWNFIIKDASGNQIGSINKKWAGAVKEIFTTADKYNVTIDPNYSNNANKIAVLCSAISIDLVMKEKK
jgi:uncharacterized protein YxjI